MTSSSSLRPPPACLPGCVPECLAVCLAGSRVEPSLAASLSSAFASVCAGTIFSIQTFVTKLRRRRRRRNSRVMMHSACWHLLPLLDRHRRGDNNKIHHGKNLHLGKSSDCLFCKTLRFSRWNRRAWRSGRNETLAPLEFLKCLALWK